jgi:hypothetical protein
VNRLVRAWRRVVLGERSREITVIDAADLKSFHPIFGADFVVRESHRETDTTTRRQRRMEQAP